MNSAQHASNILEAWRYMDRSGLGTALDRAAASFGGTQSISRFESEREEMLQSIIEHLRGLSSTNALPDCAGGSGAVTLLSHLSSPFEQPEFSEAKKSALPRISLKVGTERAKCFVEVDCKPRG